MPSSLEGTALQTEEPELTAMTAYVLVIEQFRTDIISVLEILLPKLAKGWARQSLDLMVLSLPILHSASLIRRSLVVHQYPT